MLKQPLTYDSSFTLPTGFTHSPPSFPTKFGGAGERDWTEVEESHTNRETVLRSFLGGTGGWFATSTPAGCSSTLNCSWTVGSSIVGRLTNLVVLLSSWFCPAHIGQMSWRRFVMIWAHHGVTEALCLLAGHVQRGQGLHQQLQVMYYDAML